MALPVDTGPLPAAELGDVATALDHLVAHAQAENESMDVYEFVKEEKPGVTMDETIKPTSRKRPLPEPVRPTTPPRAMQNPEGQEQKEVAAPWRLNTSLWSSGPNPGGAASSSGMQRTVQQSDVPLPPPDVPPPKSTTVQQSEVPAPPPTTQAGSKKTTDAQHRSGWQNKCATLAVAYLDQDWDECTRLITQLLGLFIFRIDIFLLIWVF